MTGESGSFISEVVLLDESFAEEIPEDELSEETAEELSEDEFSAELFADDADAACLVMTTV